MFPYVINSVHRNDRAFDFTGFLKLDSKNTTLGMKWCFYILHIFKLAKNVAQVFH